MVNFSNMAFLISAVLCYIVSSLSVLLLNERRKHHENGTHDSIFKITMEASDPVLVRPDWHISNFIFQLINCCTTLSNITCSYNVITITYLLCNVPISLDKFLISFTDSVSDIRILLKKYYSYII